MTPKEIAKLIESRDKSIRVISILDYNGDYLVTYSKNGNTLLDPFYLVSKDGKRIRGFNPSSDPIRFSEIVRRKPAYSIR